jgi:hypothetical protein
MLKRSSMIAVVLFTLWGTVFAQRVNRTDVVQHASRPILVRYANGATERYIVEWTGTASIREWEDGGPATPLTGHFVDDRRCHWEIRPVIQRKLYFVNVVGDRFAKEELTTVYQVRFENQGNAFMLLGLRSENCNDAEARFQSDVNDSHVHVMQQFTNTVNFDFQAVLNAVRGWSQVVTVSEDTGNNAVAAPQPSKPSAPSKGSPNATRR